MPAFATEARALQESIVEDRRALHQIPEVGTNLPESAAYIARRLDEIGIPWKPCGTVPEDVRQKYLSIGYPDMPASTGLVATIGQGSPCILLRADFDALPIVEENDLPFRSKRNASHMCGHDAHAAMLLGAAKILKDHEDDLSGTVKLVFQPGEEIAYGATSMIEDGVLENPHVDAAFALHVIGNGELGKLGYFTGVSSSSLDTYVLKFSGKGGHTSHPELCVDPLMVSTQIYQALNLFMTREISPEAMATLSVGALNSGTAPNVIPDSASMMFGLRTRDAQARARADERIPEIVEGYAKAWRTPCETISFKCPCTMNDASLVECLIPTFEDVMGKENIRQEEPMSSTEDFAFFSEKVPSAYATLGAGTPDAPPHHNPRMTIDESVLWMGAELYARVASDWLSRSA